jgi:hypothetical protein
MKRTPFLTAIVPEFAFSRLRLATKPSVTRLVLVSAILAGLVGVSLLYVTRPASAASITSTAAGGVWSATGTWVGGVVPGSGDDVTIANGATVTVDVAAVANSLNFQTGTANTNLNISGTNSLTVTTNLTYNAVTQNNRDFILNVAGGTLSVGGTLTFNGSATSRVNQLSIGSGTATIASITFATTSTSNRIIFTGGAGKLSTAGGLASNNTLTTVAGSTVEFTGSTSQNIGSYTYQNLRIAKTAAVNNSLGSVITINGNLIIDSGGLQDSGNQITGNATGTLTMASGAVLQIGSAGTATIFPTNFISANIALNTNSSVIYNAGVAQTVSATPTYGNLQIGNGNNSTKTLGAATTVSGNVTINGSNVLAAGTSALNVAGNWINNSSFTSGSQTTTFNGTANQSIGGTASTAFSTLAISNTGTSPNNVVSLARNITVNTALNITSGLFSQGASAADDFSLTTNTVTVSSGATWRNLGKGDVTLSGNVANSGTINLNANGTPCGDSDDIVIASSDTNQRAWSGTGAFSLTDVSVSRQGGTAIITAASSTNGGNNGANWFFLAGCTTGATYTWNGPTAGLADWTIPANWTPARAVPANNDVLIINTGFTPTLTNIPNQTIAVLRVIGNTLATLQAAAGGSTLTISGATGSDLQITSGSAATLSGGDSLTISVSSGSTGTVGGQIIVQGGAHRVLGNAASAITFQGGALFTTSTGFTGNAFGTATPDSVIFASGSSYIHNAGSSPFGTIGGTAVVVFQTGSEAQYLTPTGFDANGRTYANLTIGNGSAALNVSDSGSGDFKFDNLAINSTGSANSLFSYSGSGTCTITIQGNITSVGAGAGSLLDLMLTAGSGGIQINKPGGGTVTFGTTNQRSMDFESDATVDVNTTVNLGRILQMGLTPNKTITVNGAIVPNYLASAGYIIGKEKRTFAGPGPVNFTFDVGTINGYSPMEANNTLLAGDLTVTAAQTTAPVVDATKSLKRFWTLNGTGITTDLTFHYLDPTDIPVTSNEANYRVIRVSGGTSVSVPNNCPTPPVESACVDFVNNEATVPGVNSFSDWTLGENIAPTAVRLTGFTATTRDDGVKLEWKSGFEVDNLGYNLYRYQDGRRTRVTPSLIAGSSLIRKGGRELASGFSYGWFDNQGTVATQYELEAIDIGGGVQTFAPRYVAQAGSHGNPKKGRAEMITEVTANGAGAAAERGWAAGAANAHGAQKAAPVGAESLTTQQSIAAQTAVKMRVSQTGWYRVTQPQLVAAGFDPAADARKLQLYVDGVEVPIRLSTTQSRLAASDTLEFYGVALDTLTTDTHVYYLINGTRNGLRISTVADKGTGKQKNDSLAPNFLYTVESKERFLYLPGVLNGDSDNIFGQLVRSDPAIQTVTLKNIDTASTAPAQLEVIIQGFTQVAHSVQVQLNGSYLGTINFSGTEHKSSILAVNPALLREGDNTVTLTGSGGDADASLVDALRITYARTYRAENDSLSFSVGDRPAFVGGFTSAAIRVVDVTNPSTVKELTPKITNSGGSYGFTIQASGAVQNLIAFADNLARQPASMVKNQPSNWNASTNSADMLIVTHGDFRDSADALATARRAQGLKVSVVYVEDVFDEFSYGAHTPQALRDFFARSNGIWATAPRYVLLFGDSSWDPRNYLGQGYNDFVPTKLVASFELETASDDWLADFNNDGLPELAVGRLPARTSAEASTMVSKILNYDQERLSGAPLRGALLVADNGFESQTDQVQSLLAPLTTVQTLSRSAIGNDNIMRTQIVDAIDQGPTIVNYFGHGSVTVWTGAGLLNEENASTLTNGNRPSLFVMMTCLNGYAGDAFIDSLAEVVLKNPQGGAFAVWASSGITDPVGQAQMNGQLYQLLLGAQPQRLGDAVRQAKMSTSDMDVRRTWILLGDPTMRLR